MKLITPQQYERCPLCATRPIHYQRGSWRQCEACKRRLKCLGAVELLCQNVCLYCFVVHFMEAAKPRNATD